MREALPADRAKLTADQAQALANIAYANKDVKAFAAAGRGIKNLDVTVEQLEKCNAPFLFIYGSKEADATKQRAAQILKSLPRGELKVIDGADHISTLANPEFGNAIKEFLRANKQQ